MAKSKLGKRGRQDQDAWAEIDGAPVHFLMGQSIEEFRERVWEQAPKLCKPSPDSGARRQLFSSLASKQVVQDMLAGVKHVEPGVDINAARCIDGLRETLLPEEATSAAFWKLYKKQGCTLQVMQPQRWSDGLWRLAAALEAQLGCLVGVNIYVTPAGTQGLAPHHDDVELWICQTQGSKRWRLYAPHMQLPALPSPDFTEDAIGQPTMEVTLQEGDVLYMPRGTIHQAVAQETDSVHLTISTYQRWTHGELLQRWTAHAAGASSDEEALPFSLRQGLPFNAATQGDLAAAAAAMAAGLQEMAEQLRRQPEALQPAIADLASDFMASRLPPHPDQLPALGECPGMEDSAVARHPQAACVLDCPEPDAAEVPEELQGIGFVKVMHCLKNSRVSHMIMRDSEEPHSHGGCCSDGHDHADADGEPSHQNGHAVHAPAAADSSSSEADAEDDADSADDDDSEADFVFPGSYGGALRSLLSGSPCQVSQLDLPSNEERLGLVHTLWSEGLVTQAVTPAAGSAVKGQGEAGQQGQKRKKAGQ